MNAPDFLVESIPNAIHGSAALRDTNPWLAVIFPLILSSAAGALCYVAAGISLGLFLGGFILTSLIAGPMVAPETTWLGRAMAVAGTIHGIAGVWLYAILKADLDLGLWAASYLALVSMTVALAGLTVLLRSLGLGRIGSGALVSLLGAAWLLWPIWLAPVLHGPRAEQAVSWLVPAHPIFAANGVLRDRLGYWADNGVAYNLTNLNDDIAYSVPDNVLKCVLLHLGIGAVCVGVVVLRGRVVRSPPSSLSSSS